MNLRLWLKVGVIIGGLLLFFVVVFFWSVSGYARRVSEAVQPGDLVFQKCKSQPGMVIRLATKSEYDHVGIVMIQGGQKCVLEAIEPVLITPLNEWVRRAPFTSVVVAHPLFLKQISASRCEDILGAAAREFAGKPYDYLLEWSDDREYCSELVWKVFKRHFHVELCPLQCLRDFNITNPLVAKYLKKTYGEAIPYEQEVISPDALLHSPAVQSIVVNRW